MKNDSIRDAWDSVNPTPTEKDRMMQRLLDAMPEEKPKPTVYQARHVKTKWWSAIPAAAACVAMLVLGGFVLTNLEREAPQPQVQTSPVETTEASEPITEATEAEKATEEAIKNADTPFMQGDYQTYVTWIRYRNQTDPYSSRDTTQYYAYYDLNGDGIKDLLIGDEDGSIEEAITCVDGQLSLLFGVGCNFRICEDGSIYTGGEGDTHFVWYRLSDYSHTVTMTVWYDEQKKSWCLYNSDTGVRQTITKQRVEDILDSCIPIELEMRNLNCFQPE